MSKGTLLDKVVDNHTVGMLESGQTQVYVGGHRGHEVTSPQSFEMLEEKGIKVRRPDLTKFVMDHVNPTDDVSRPYKDEKAELMAATLEKNMEKNPAIDYFRPGEGQGVCHVVFLEKGTILPGMFVVCGDSHACTYGAVGAIAIGIGTTQVYHVLATQTIAMDKLKVRRINFTGERPKGTVAKDLALALIAKLGVAGGVGHAYEFGGNAIDEMNMEGRMTLCNMAVEGGARSGYVNPDQKTFDYLRGREFAPKEDFDKAVNYWKSLASDPDAAYDDVVEIHVDTIKPMVTWGTNPEQAIRIDGVMPTLEDFAEGKARDEAKDAFDYMGLKPGESIEGTPVDVAFIGSCTNGRLSDLEQAAYVFEGHKVVVKTLVVPGSEEVMYAAEAKGLDKIFIAAGAEWRRPGCSLCLAMNPDKLEGYQRSISTSNRNFKGRQGSPTGRTHLASPATVAASAIEGKIVDLRRYI